MKSLLIAELKLQSRHWLWLLAMVLTFAFGAFVINKQTPDMDIQISGSYFLIKTFAIQLLLLPVLVAIFSTQATIRDFESDMAGIVYASSTKLTQVLIARFIAFFILCWSVYLSFGAGIFVGLATQQSIYFGLPIASLCWALFVLALPNVLLVCAIFFAIGLYGKRSIYLYLIACLLFFAYQFFLSINGSPLMASRVVVSAELASLYSWIDPFALSTYFEQVRQWQPSDKNTQLPTLDRVLIINRLLVIFAALAVTVYTIMHHVKNFKIDAMQDESMLIPNWIKRMTFSLTSSFALPFIARLRARLPAYSVLTIAHKEWQLSFKTKTFLAMCCALVFLISSEIYFGYIHLENLGTSAIASTMITVNRYIADILPRFGGLFMLFLAAELCWRDQQSKVKSLIDSTRVSNAALFFGRLLALCFVPLFFITLSIIVSIIMQSANGGEFDFDVYLSMYVYFGLPLIWLATLCVVVHALLPNKYLALGISFALFVFFETSLLQSLGLEHPLWTLGQLPPLSYSEFVGFGGELDALAGYLSFRYSLLIVLSLIAFKFFRRGEELSSAFTSPVLWRRNEKAILICGAVAVIITLGNIVHQTWYTGHYQSSSSRHVWKASYENKYAYLKDQPSLSTEKITTIVELMPDERRLTINANYQLVNRSNRAISQLVFSTPLPFNYRNVAVGNAEQVSYDQFHQTHIYAFSQPIQPGQSVTLSFVADYQQNGYLGVPGDNVINSDYSYIRFLRYLPFLGYVKHYQLTNNGLREKFALPKLSHQSIEQDLEKYQGDMSALYDWATLDTTIVTSEDHIAFAPGKLVKQWQEGNRKIYQYRTQGKVRNIGHIVSQNLPVKTAQIAHTNVDVFYPEGKENYAERHLSAIRDALQYGNEHFGPVMTNNLRLVPFPSFFPATGYALPQTVFIGEEVGFHVDLTNKDGFDHLYRRTVHEVAHQWWGHGLNGAATEGEAVLVETLAKYTEMVLLARKYGDEYVKQLIKYEQQRYFSGRSRTNINELPLYRGDENYLIYSKGAAAMYALKQQLGESAINTALKKLVTLHSFPNKPATTLDFIAYLTEGKTAKQQQLVDNWFKKIIVHDVEITSAELSKSEQGHEINVCLQDNKTDLTTVKLSAFTDDEKLIASTDIIANTKQGINACKVWSLETKPSHIELDSELLLLDSNRENNQFYFPSL
ncbi:M1 family aminopeptidase [Thalassotalea sp. 1_MG-2023]|uniref:M1 family aminopeptidase n=1 Tax=Thalassotalea sp. 1_MG-2023 TaxID=3062680 RepID=UPI0026E48EE9|nr:M1 family aminopeptidase [Thalassotalea sp. 1_MG-2023]MDO6427234.1 M1 family aminopeptidase [Thalassotalea sp. 1_MG-2023]